MGSAGVAGGAQLGPTALDAVPELDDDSDTGPCDADDDAGPCDTGPCDAVPELDDGDASRPPTAVVPVEDLRQLLQELLRDQTASIVREIRTDLDTEGAPGGLPRRLWQGRAHRPASPGDAGVPEHVGESASELMARRSAPRVLEGDRREEFQGGRDHSEMQEPVEITPRCRSRSPVPEKDTAASEYIKRSVEVIMKKKRASKIPLGAKNFPIRWAKEVRDSLKWVRNDRYSHASSFATYAYAAYLGVEAAVQLDAARRADESGSGMRDERWIAVDWLFALVFSVDIVLRCAAFQVSFFRGTMRWWNAADIFTLFAMMVAATVEQFASSSAQFWVVVFQNARLYMLLRTIRTSKVRHILILKTLVYTLAGSAQAFLSAIALLVFTQFGFCIMFMHGLRVHLENPQADLTMREDLLLYFGSFPDAFFTLLLAGFGGGDWEKVSRALWDMGPWYKWAFAGYIVFTILLLLNILNGVFVNAAIESAAHNKQLAIEITHEKMEDMIAQMTEWFIEADKDRSGMVTLDELRKLLGHQSVREYFMANGVDHASAAQIWLLLDQRGTGEVNAGEFVDHLISLQGNAKAIDLASLRLLCNDISKRMAGMEKTVRKAAGDPSSLTASPP